MAKKVKSSKADRQRKSAQNLRYIAEGRHRKSHVKRLMAHLERFPNDQAAAAKLKEYGG